MRARPPVSSYYFPKPSDKELMEGASFGPGEIKRLGHQEIISDLKKFNRDLEEIIRVLEIVFKDEI